MLVKVTKRAVHINAGWRFLVWEAVSGNDVEGLDADGYATRELAAAAAVAAGHEVVNEPISAAERAAVAALGPEPTTNEALRAIGMSHRKVGGTRHHYEDATGKVRFVGSLQNVNAWLGIEAPEPKPARPKRCRHDFRDGDVCSKCDAAKAVA